MRGTRSPADVAQGPWSAERSENGAVTAVMLPGSGSDDRFVRSVFGRPLAAIGITLLAPAPVPGAAVIAGYLAALDDAAAGAGPILVGGVSLGAHVATAWAVRHADELGDRLRGVLAALPAWTGPPAGAPAAGAALATAATVRHGGLAAAVGQARHGAPAWLAAELERAWTGYGSGLAASLEAAAAEPAPTPEELAGLTAPVGIAAVSDDPVHPHAVARTWAGLLPHAAVTTTDLATFGADPAVLGAAALAAWRQAASA